jgi:hypothetical protein
MAIWTLKVTKKCLNQKTRQKKEQLPLKVTALFNTAPRKRTTLKIIKCIYLTEDLLCFFIVTNN